MFYRPRKTTPLFKPEKLGMLAKGGRAGGGLSGLNNVSIFWDFLALRESGGGVVGVSVVRAGAPSGAGVGDASGAGYSDSEESDGAGAAAPPGLSVVGAVGRILRRIRRLRGSCRRRNMSWTGSMSSAGSATPWFSSAGTCNAVPTRSGRPPGRLPCTGPAVCSSNEATASARLNKKNSKACSTDTPRWKRMASPPRTPPHLPGPQLIRPRQKFLSPGSPLPGVFPRPQNDPLV